MKVLIVYHTVYGHMQTMAKAVQEGAQGVGGVEVASGASGSFRKTYSTWNKKRDTAIRFTGLRKRFLNALWMIYGQRME